MDGRTPGRKSASDDFTAVKRLDHDDDPTSLVTVDDDLTRSSHPPAPPPPPAGALPVGTRIGDYIVEELVGQGGMGSVYRAVHPVIGKYAAIKVLDTGTDQYNVERFLDEARVVNQIGHPNIVDVFAFGETHDGRSYLVMEWLKGETLRKRLDRVTPSISELCDIVKPLTRALMAAHDKGVVHRDLKPDNVFLVEVHGEPPIVKLLDFGIAKPASTEHRVAKTATGAIVGTPLYIAPEQAKGRAIDSSADVYALGGMVFEMLCRRPPFVADNAMEIVAKHLMEPPPRPSQFAKVPPALDDLVLSMLAKEPVDRPLLAAVIKVLDLVRDQPIAASVVAAAAAERDTRGHLMQPFESDIGIQPWRPPTPTPTPAPMPEPVRAASVTPFPQEARTPFPLRPSTEATTPVDAHAMSRPTMVAGPMTEMVSTPSARWKWMLPIGVIAAGAIAFAITSALGGGDKPVPRAVDRPAPEPPAAEPTKPQPTSDPIADPPKKTEPEAKKPEPEPAKPEPAKTVAKPDVTPTKPTPEPSTQKPTVKKPPTPPRKPNTPPKPRPAGGGSGTIKVKDGLLEPS